LAWTTTPWTLPSNLAIAANPDFIYIKAKDNKTNEVYIFGKLLMKEIEKTLKTTFTITEEI